MAKAKGKAPAKAKTSKAPVPAATAPVPGKASKRFTWQKGDIVIHSNGQLPPGSKPIKPPKAHTPAKPKA